MRKSWAWRRILLLDALFVAPALRIAHFFPSPFGRMPGAWLFG